MPHHHASSRYSDFDSYTEFTSHLDCLLQSYLFLTTTSPHTIRSNTQNRKMEELLHHALHTLSKFHFQPPSNGLMAIELKNLTSVAEKLGCVHKSDDEERRCKWQEVHHMIGAK
ncbi:MAG: hypothetical protein LQ338_007472, partial [Usnochroma carphineum]